MLPVAATLWAGLAALSLMLCGWRSLGREAERLERGLGAVDSAAIARNGGWTAWQLDRAAAELRGVARLGGIAPDAGDGLVGMAGDFAATRDWTWSPRPPDRLDLHGSGRVAWVPKESAAREGWEPGRTLEVAGVAWRIAGVYEAGGQTPPGVAADAAWVPAGALEEWRPEAGRIRMALVRAEAGTDPETARMRADAVLRRVAGEEPDWLTPDLLAGRLKSWRRTLAVALGWGGGVCLVLAALGMASLQLMGVRERIPEIGLRRALGARPGDVAALFLAEAVLLVVLAGVASSLAAAAVAAWLDGRIPLALHPVWTDFALPFAVALPVILAASLFPARAAARLDPAEALRSE